MHSRRRPTVEIATSKLLIPKDVILNDTLVQLYSKLNRGDINLALTRLPISIITSGYYGREADGAVIFSNLNQKHIPVMQRAIRGGSRPSLDLYWSPLAPGGGGYVCADDETALAAYSRLNFAWVPCKVAPVCDTYKSF